MLQQLVPVDSSTVLIQCPAASHEMQVRIEGQGQWSYRDHLCLDSAPQMVQLPTQS